MIHENVCSVCGGIKHLNYKATTLPGTSIPVMQPIVPRCEGHAEGEKHSGKLEAMCDPIPPYQVNWIEIPFGFPLMHIQIGDEDTFITLDPKQALSLLEWLRQEESMLKILAKEEEA
jgi:hypothetical protein